MDARHKAGHDEFRLNALSQMMAHISFGWNQEDFARKSCREYVGISQIRTSFERHERHGRTRHHGRRQDPVPALGLNQRDEVRIGAERPGPGFNSGGFGFAGYFDVRRPGFAVQSGGIDVRLRLRANGVGFRVREAS